AYCLWLSDPKNQNSPTACYCHGMIVSTLDKPTGISWFTRNCVNVLIKVGDAIEVPIRLLSLLSSHQIVDLGAMRTDERREHYDQMLGKGFKIAMSKGTFVRNPTYVQYTLSVPVGGTTGLICMLPHNHQSAHVGGKSYPRKMEEKATNDKHVLVYNNVISLNTRSPVWRFLESVYKEKAYWILWDAQESPQGTSHPDATVQMWDQGKALVAGTIGYIVNMARSDREGEKKFVAIVTNFKGPFRQHISCLPSDEEFLTKPSIDGSENVLKLRNGQSHRYYFDASTGFGVEQQKVLQTEDQLKSSNSTNFQRLYGLLGVDGIMKGRNPVIPPGTFLAVQDTEFWQTLGDGPRNTMKKQINEFRLLFETQLRLGFFSPNDILHEHQLNNHHSEDDPTSWIWCYLVLQGGTWCAETLWVGTTEGSESRRRRSAERLTYLIDHCGYDTVEDKYNKDASCFDMKVPKKQRWKRS
ncbi:hypothetical protein TrRE_jg9949, partial [Triparma retinervis]